MSIRSYVNNVVSLVSNDMDNRYPETVHSFLSVGYHLMWECACNSDLSIEQRYLDIDMLLLSTLVVITTYTKAKHPENAYYITPDHDKITYDKLLDVIRQQIGTEQSSISCGYLIKKTSENVMAGTFSIPYATFAVAFPRLQAELDLIQRKQKIYEKFEQVKQQFPFQINEAGDIVLGNQTLDSAQKAFLKAYLELERRTLVDFKSKKKNFDYEACLFLADCASHFASKVLSKQVTRKDLDAFKDKTTKYQSSSWFDDLLGIMIGLVISMGMGALIGVSIGGLPGAAIGAATALAVVGVAGFFAKKQHDLRSSQTSPLSVMQTEVNHMF